MTTHEYHQLLKFLYFEGYADSYEEAEYIIEEMDDEEFDSLCEEVFPSDPLVDYLLDEGYTDTVEGAEVIVENMSEEWAYHILQEMRKEDKVAGKKKTPMYDTKTHKRLELAGPGSGRKWKRADVSHKTPNEKAMAGRLRQGLTATPDDKSHGGQYLTVGGRMHRGRMHSHGIGGSNRGVKKKRGGPESRSEMTPVERIKRKLDIKRSPVTSWDYKTGKYM